MCECDKGSNQRIGMKIVSNESGKLTELLSFVLVSKLAFCGHFLETASLDFASFLVYYQVTMISMSNIWVMFG